MRLTVNLRRMLVIALLSLPSAAPGAHAQAARAKPDATARAVEILNESMSAAGGAALERIERVQIISSGDLFGNGSTVPVDVMLRVAFPDRVRMSMANPQFGVFDCGFDGKDTWTATPEGSIRLPVEMNNESLRGIGLIAGIGLYRSVKSGAAKARFTGEKGFQRKKALEIEWAGAGSKMKLYFDRQTKLLIGARYRVQTPQGDFDEELAWSDFRNVEGVQFPFRLDAYRDGQKFLKQIAAEVKCNTPMDARIFSRP